MPTLKVDFEKSLSGNMPDVPEYASINIGTATLEALRAARDFVGKHSNFCESITLEDISGIQWFEISLENELDPDYGHPDDTFKTDSNAITVIGDSFFIRSTLNGYTFLSDKLPLDLLLTDIDPEEPVEFTLPFKIPDATLESAQSITHVGSIDQKKEALRHIEALTEDGSSEAIKTEVSRLEGLIKSFELTLPLQEASQITVIDSETSYQRGIRALEALWGAEKDTKEEKELLRLVNLIETYEKAHYTIGQPSKSKVSRS